MIRPAILLILTLSACVNHTPSPVLTRSTHQLTEFEQYCMEMFRNILAVQDERDANNNTMNEVNNSYTREEISRDDHRAFFDKWKVVEIQMRDKVTLMYDEAYDNGCFSHTTPASHVLRWRKIK